ncbi:DUF6233 domain-containing protein [Streptomyces griseus]|uniref:DUF6233 domain-containing protein n=1 Tax=Streptomyces griseus TaxID=1911 RepID=UPI003CCF2C85
MALHLPEAGPCGDRGGRTAGAASRAPRPPAAVRAAVPRREPTSDWGIFTAGIGRSVAEIHRGDCFAGGAKQPLSAERARAELADGVPAYGVCRPDWVLNRMGPDAARGRPRCMGVLAPGVGGGPAPGARPPFGPPPPSPSGERR